MHHGVMKGGLLALLLSLAPAAALAAQSQADRADPSLAGQDMSDERTVPGAPRLPLALEPNPSAPVTDDERESILVGAVRVEGATALAPSAFAAAIEPYLGRPLSAADLRSLATD